jgi:hypothetical protein
MLRWEEEVKPMIEATYNARDAAMIALQFDAGYGEESIKPSLSATFNTTTTAYKSPSRASRDVAPCC